MQILFFTLLQSLLSTTISLGFGFALAWCITWSHPAISKIIRPLLALPLLTPSIVGLLGYITLFSNHGRLGGVLPLYGLWGIVGAHTFFYAPFVAIFLWQAWQHIPVEQRLLSQQLNLSWFQSYRFSEAPILKPYLYTAGWIVFCMSLASFTTVLVLGGGPSSTTLPVALYQSLFNSFDSSQAILFAGMQIFLCVVAYSGMALLPKHKPQPTNRLSFQVRVSSIATSVSVGLGIILLLPLLVVFYESAHQLSSLFSEENLLALNNSISIALWVGPISTIIAITGLMLCSELNRLLSFVGSAFLIAPLPLFGFGAFWLQHYWDGLANFPIVVLLNVLLTLPFAIHFLNVPVAQTKSNYSRLSASLGMNNLKQARIIFIPLLVKPIGQSLGFCSALAAGDLTALLMFSDYESPGLSSLLYQQMGGYRGGEAMATACLLILLCATIIIFFQATLKESKHA